MPELRGLTGVKGALPCRHVASIDKAVLLIAWRRRAVTAAGPDDAVNVWRDDEKRIRSNFNRYLVTVDEAAHEDLDCLRAWLNVWWPKMRRDEA